MRAWNILVFVILACSIQITVSRKCHSESKKIECSATEYQNYVDCIRNRIKRSADCDDEEEEEEDCYSNQCEKRNSCDSCDCNECTSSDCGSSCNKRCCSSCCKFKECSTNHCCHKVCHNSCRSSSCRSSCRRSCYKTVTAGSSAGDRTGSIISNSSNNVANKGNHNVTTIIHLNNLINNTNLIDVPINLNNSNINNITVENSQNGSSTIGSSSTGQCCSVVEPRQCVQTATYPYISCFNYRRQQCGQFCRAPVVHKVAQNVCYNTQTQNPTCGQQIIYVPQPQSSCSYQPQWPYISCTNQGTNCNGCYDYLLNPFRVQRTCGSSCYNYGLNQGAVYRQGPVMSPGYALPLPPLQSAIPSGCNSYGGCGMGNFINPGMYYGTNPYSSYGIYGSYTPYSTPMMQGYGIGMQMGGYGNNLMSPLEIGGLGNLPIEQFVPMNFTASNSSNVLYGILTNTSSPMTSMGTFPGDVYGQPITIDEELFKKLLGQGNVQSNTATDSEKSDDTSSPRAQESEITTTPGSPSLFGL